MKIRDENIRNSDQHYLTSDIKLQAFLRLMLPDSFIGLNKANPHKINFVFNKSNELTELINGYLLRKQYLISPLALAENIDQGKAMIYGDY